jgi:hypothetical protein
MRTDWGRLRDEWLDRLRLLHCLDGGVSGSKTLAPETERAEIKIHPIGCPERRSSIQRAELESFQPRTPSSRGFGRRKCPARKLDPGSDDGRAAPRQPG